MERRRAEWIRMSFIRHLTIDFDNDNKQCDEFD